LKDVQSDLERAQQLQQRRASGATSDRGQGEGRYRQTQR